MVEIMIMLGPLKEGGIRPLMGLIYSLSLEVNLSRGGGGGRGEM